MREWLDQNGNFRFGKYKDDSIDDIAIDDPNYLRWILETVEDIVEEDRAIIRSSLSLTRKGRR